ncbi:hypothetical protein HDU98_008576 [Podochytrium sp. JEL0797]|nr:hypothetical protein HDU98_008576 [Podochytrium sp. JEL0797]
MNGFETPHGRTCEQEALQQRLEEFRRKRDQEKLKDKINRLRDKPPGGRAFVVTAPKKDPLQDYIPSIIYEPSSAEKPKYSHTPTARHARKSWVPSQQHLSSPTTSIAVQTEESLDESKQPAKDDWNLHVEMSKLFEEAKRRADSTFDRVRLEHCFRAFEVIFKDVANSPTTATPQRASNLPVASRTTPITPSTPAFVEKSTPIHDSSSTPSHIIRPPTPSFLSFRTPTQIIDDEDEAPSKPDIVAPAETTYDDDEVAFGGHPNVASDEDDMGANVTPPRSKYLSDAVLPEQEGDENVVCLTDTLSSGIKWESETPCMDDEFDVNEDVGGDDYEDGGFDGDDVSFAGGDGGFGADDIPAVVESSKASKNGTPHPHKPRTPRDVGNELASMLSGIRLDEDSGSNTPVKSVRKSRDGKQLKVGFMPVSGVKLESDSVAHPTEIKIGPKSTDGSVVVLTPRKASKKEKAYLGVDSVVTNARRSLRFMPIDLTSSPPAEPSNPTTDSDTGTAHIKKEPGLFASTRLAASGGPLSAFGPDARERINRLLEEHGNAFVPNKVLSMPDPTPPAPVAARAATTSPSRIRQPSAVKRTPLTKSNLQDVFGVTGSPSGSPFKVHSVNTRVRDLDLKEDVDMTPRARRH